MDNVEKALEIIDLVLQKEKYHIKAIKYCGQLNYKIGNLDKAMASFHLILKMDENDLDAMHQLALCYFDRKKYLIVRFYIS